MKIITQTRLNAQIGDKFCSPTVIHSLLSGMFTKFHSFGPISFHFLTYVMLSYFIRLHCANIHIHSPSFSFLWLKQTSNEARPDKAVYWRYSKYSKRYWSNKTLLDNLIILWTQIPIPVRIMPSYPSFSSISPYLCKTSCPKHNIKLHNYASRLLRQHMAHAYGQDTLYWL